MYWITIAFFILLAALIAHIIFLKTPTEQKQATQQQQNAIIKIHNTRLKLLAAGNFNKSYLEISANKIKEQVNKEINSAIDQTQYHYKKNKNIYLILLFVLTIPIFTYIKTSSFKQLNYDGTVKTPPPSKEAQKVIDAIKQIKNKLQANPYDITANRNIIDIYMRIKLYQQAIKYADRIIEIEPQQAQNISLKALILYMDNKGVMTAQIMQLAKQALTKDPLDAQANTILGYHHNSQGEFAAAIKHWENLLSNPEVDTNQIQTHINQAKQALQAQKGTVKFKLTVDLTIAPAIKHLAKPNDYLFIAIKTKNSPMPIAAIKQKVGQLPKQIVVTENNIINRSIDINQATNLVAEAIISRSGNLPSKKGDLIGKINIASITEQANISINTIKH